MKITAEVEAWRPIPGWPGYEASDLGRIRSVDRVVMRRNGQPQTVRGRVLRQVVRYDGRHTVMLPRGEREARRKRFVHQLVLEAFVGPCPSGMECCHADDDSSNNRLNNLRWDTHQANTRDRRSNRGSAQMRRTHCPRNHPLVAPNLIPSELPRRACLACNRASRRVGWWLRVKGVQLDLRQQSDAYYAELIRRGGEAGA